MKLSRKPCRIILYDYTILKLNEEKKRTQCLSTQIIIAIHAYLLYTTYSYVPYYALLIYTYICVHTYIHTNLYYYYHHRKLYPNGIRNCFNSASSRQSSLSSRIPPNSLTHTHSHGYFLFQPLNLTSKNAT